MAQIEDVPGPPARPPQDVVGGQEEALTRTEEARRRGAAGRGRLEERYRPAHAAAAWRAAVAIENLGESD